MVHSSSSVFTCFHCWKKNVTYSDCIPSICDDCLKDGHDFKSSSIGSCDRCAEIRKERSSKMKERS